MSTIKDVSPFNNAGLTHKEETHKAISERSKQRVCLVEMHREGKDQTIGNYI